MKNKQITIFKWLLLAVFLTAAGIFYSCSGRDTARNAVPAQENRAFQAESAPKTAEEETGKASLKKRTEAEAGSENTKVADDSAAAGKAESEETSETGSEPEMAAVEEQESCYVYVCGEVITPGVYTLSEGARIYEAVALAGGFTEQAAESWLNLAEPVVDGMKLEVPSEAQVQDPSWLAQNSSGGSAGNGAASKTGSQSGAAGTTLVNINTASREQLMTLKGIGASRAEDIIRYREENGGFTKTEDIMKVPGIKNGAFQKIKENITV